jgi:hypothetical protein
MSNSPENHATRTWWLLMADAWMQGCIRIGQAALSAPQAIAPGLPWRLEHGTMPTFKKKPQMTTAEFNAAFREAGFGVDHGRVVDVSGKCPGFATFPAFHRRGVVNRNATLAKAIRERDAEIARRTAATERPA